MTLTIIIVGSFVLAIVFGMTGLQWWVGRQENKKAVRIIQNIMEVAGKVPPVRLVVTRRSITNDDTDKEFALSEYRTHRPKVEAIIRFGDFRDGLGRKFVDVAVVSKKVRALVVEHFKGKNNYDVSTWADGSFRVFVPQASSV